jgi:hypothetical protein
MSRDFDKADFQKGTEKEICNHCGTEEGTFTLIKDKLIEVDTDHYNRGHNRSLTLRRKPAIDSLIKTLRKNIFSSIDKIGEDLISGLHSWSTRLEQSSRKPKEKGLLEVMRSPLSVLAPRLLSNQFKAEEVFEGVKYCDYCGAEQSRSLMYSGLFIPFAGAENQEKEVVNYFGRIRDIEAEVLPLIQDLWEEQGEEFKRREKKANKMWDSAEDRLKKKKEDEKERKRQAEIAKLEKRLKAIKNNDE